MTTLTPGELAGKAKAEIKLGDVAKAAAEKHYIAAGKWLLKAKDAVKRSITFKSACGQEPPPGSIVLGGKVTRMKWGDYLELHGIAERTARLYMSLALGKTTLARVRSENRKSASKLREKTALRHAATTVSITRQPGYTIPLTPKARKLTRKQVAALNKVVTHEPPHEISPRYVKPSESETDEHQAVIIDGKLEKLEWIVAELMEAVRGHEHASTFSAEIHAAVGNLMSLIKMDA